MDALKKVVSFTEVLAALVAVSFVLLLFVNEPQKAPPIPKKGTEDAGATIFATRCASCHGADGGGGFGPALAGVVVQRFPNEADQIAVVTNGRGSMPSFGDSLTPEQVKAVADYTRTGLG